MSMSRLALTTATGKVLLLGLLSSCGYLQAQVNPAVPNTDLLFDNNTFSSTKLSVTRYVQLDATSSQTRRINTLALRPGDNDAFYSVSQDGRVHRVVDQGGVGVATEWFNAGANNPLGVSIDTSNTTHGGLRSIAFHPDFADETKAGYGKLYGSLSTSVKGVAGSAPLIGTSASGGNAESLVAEWTFDFSAGMVDTNSYRELFRVGNTPRFDHPIKSLSFNTAAIATDSDYGLLYVGYGDASSSQEFGGNAFGTGQDLTNALGKVLRVNPLQSGQDRYTTPGNTYALDGDTNTMAEIYSAGHRNPHHLNFGRTARGDTKLIVAEVGQDLIEEVNVLDITFDSDGLAANPGEDNGFNYGWGLREGTFVRRLGDGGYGVQDPNGPNNDPGSADLLPIDDALNNFIYPSIQIDHNDPTNIRNSDAVAGGPVINGRYFYGNFSGNSTYPGGEIYSVTFEQLTSQKTQLETGETPDELTWIDDLTQHKLIFDGSEYDTFAQVLTADGAGSQFRTDFRFGVSPAGDLLVSSKRNGVIYVLTELLPLGDLRLTLNADTGETSISSSTGAPVNITGYGLASNTAQLDPSQWNPLTGNGWNVAGSPSQNNLDQTAGPIDASTQGGSAIGATPISLGNALNVLTLAPQPFGVPLSTDVSFEYTTAEGSLVQGQVELIGNNSYNTLVLRVDPETGEATLTNSSVHTVNLEGYSILSASGSLVAAGWDSLDDQNIDNTGVSGTDGFVQEANTPSPPNEFQLSELIPNTENDARYLTLRPGVSFDLGMLFNPSGSQDLELEFLLNSGSVAAGDFNEDGVVNLGDYTVWRDGLGGQFTTDDYLIWKNNFGATSDGSGMGLTIFDGVVAYGAFASEISSGTAPVPEPRSSLVLLLLANSLLWLRKATQTL